MKAVVYHHFLHAVEANHLFLQSSFLSFSSISSIFSPTLSACVPGLTVSLLIPQQDQSATNLQHHLASGASSSVQYFVRRHHSIQCWDLERNCFLITWVLCDMTQCAYGRRVGGDDETVFATSNGSLGVRVWKGNVGKAGHEGNISR